MRAFTADRSTGWSGFRHPAAHRVVRVAVRVAGVTRVPVRRVRPVRVRGPFGAGRGGQGRTGAAQAAWRRMAGTLIGREAGPPTCENGWVRQSSP
ncbi:hypothetical protein GCM10027073_49660 [Streptomyces chlorus]